MANEDRIYFKDRLVEPKFKVGDWITSSVLGTARIMGVNDSNEYQLEDTDGKQKFSNIDYVNHAYDKWTIQDAKDGDVLAMSWLEDKNLWEQIIIFKKYHGQGVEGYHGKCVEGYGNTFKNGEIAFTDENVPYYSKTWTCYLYPATKEQHTRLFQKIESECIFEKLSYEQYCSTSTITLEEWLEFRNIHLHNALKLYTCNLK